MSIVNFRMGKTPWLALNLAAPPISFAVIDQPNLSIISVILLPIAWILTLSARTQHTFWPLALTLSLSYALTRTASLNEPHLLYAIYTAAVAGTPLVIFSSLTRMGWQAYVRRPITQWTIATLGWGTYELSLYYIPFTGPKPLSDGLMQTPLSPFIALMGPIGASSLSVGIVLLIGFAINSQLKREKPDSKTVSASALLVIALSAFLTFSNMKPQESRHFVFISGIISQEHVASLASWAGKGDAIIVLPSRGSKTSHYERLIKHHNQTLGDNEQTLIAVTETDSHTTPSLRVESYGASGKLRDELTEHSREGRSDDSFDQGKAMPVGDIMIGINQCTHDGISRYRLSLNEPRYNETRGILEGMVQGMEDARGWFAGCGVVGVNRLEADRGVDLTMPDGRIFNLEAGYDTVEVLLHSGGVTVSERLGGTSGIGSVFAIAFFLLIYLAKNQEQQDKTGPTNIDK